MPTQRTYTQDELNAELASQRTALVDEVKAAIEDERLEHTKDCQVPSGCEDCAYNGALDDILSRLQGGEGATE